MGAVHKAGAAESGAVTVTEKVQLFIITVEIKRIFGMNFSVKVVLYPQTAADCLKGSFLVTVHSVYHHTVNLRAGERLLAIQPRSAAPTPFGITTSLSGEEFECLTLRQGERGLWSGGELQLGCLRLDLKTGELWQPRITPVPEELRRPRFLSGLEQTIARGREKSALARSLEPDRGEAETPLGQLYHRYISQAGTLAGQGAFSSAARQYCMLIGLGDGLTPAGDDFLVGLLAALRGLEQEEQAVRFRTALEEEVEAQLAKTNDISAEFLRYACRGAFSRPLCQLFSPAEPEAALDWLAGIGHSSGIDTLTGVREGLALYRSLTAAKTV